MIMKIVKTIFTIVVGGLLLASCSKQLIPGFKSGKTGVEYDSAAFNYAYVEGMRQKLLGNMGEALRFFEHCLDINPQSDATYYQIAQIVLGNGDMPNGKKYVKKANELDPENLWYNMLLASIYNQEGNLDSTIICYEKAVKIYPDRENLQISLAKLYSQEGNYEKARNILYRLDEKYGVNETTTISLIESLMVEKKFDEALQKVNKLLEVNPDDIVFNGYLAEIYKSQGDMQKAKDVYHKLIERNPDNPDIQLSLCDFLISGKNYDELFDLLNIIILNQKITREEKISLIARLIENEEILKEYARKLELSIMIFEANFKDDDIVILLRPELLQKDKRSKEAAERLEEIIKINPDNYFAWEKLLLVYYDLKDFKLLEQRGEECATKFNRSVIAKMLYATAAMENEKFGLSLEELRKAEILSGDNKGLLIQVITLRADTYYRMKNYVEAFNEYEKALKLDNSDLTVMNNYAYYLAEQDMNLKEAEKMSREVIEKDKTNDTFMDTYAWVLYKRGKYKEAAKIMETILSSGSKSDAEYYEHYGFILKKMKKCNDAVKSWETALSVDNTKTYLKKEIENCGK
jgi:tetratricopeptide (TPR) repeat protein